MYVPAAHGNVILQQSSPRDNTHTAFVREHREKCFMGVLCQCVSCVCMLKERRSFSTFKVVFSARVVMQHEGFHDHRIEEMGVVTSI